MSSIGDRLDAARSQLFVGRDAEVERFRAASRRSPMEDMEAN
jgi:hypothetical protein